VVTGGRAAGAAVGQRRVEPGLRRRPLLGAGWPSTQRATVGLAARTKAP